MARSVSRHTDALVKPVSVSEEVSIPTAGCGHFLASREDVELFAAYAYWYIDQRGYAYTITTDGRCVNAASLILPPLAGYDVDHENQNTLDNQRHNLRYLTHADNAANCPVRKHSVSGVKGVRWHVQSRTWAARITINGRPRSLGYFHDRAIAAAVFVVAHRYYHPALYPGFALLLDVLGITTLAWHNRRARRTRTMGGRFAAEGVSHV